MNDRRRYALLVPLVGLAPLLAAATRPALAAPNAPASDQALLAMLRKALERSAQGWAADDLDAFMSVYEDSPRTLYVNGDKNVVGKAAIRRMYGERFGKGAGSLGTLSVDLEDLRRLGADHVLVVGHFRLHGPAADKPDATGVFTLVFHHAGGMWRIVVDHTG